MELKKSFSQIFIYAIVGGIATLVEWIIFYLCDTFTPIHYQLSTAIAFFFSTFANWIFGKLLLFKEKTKSVILELLQIYLVSIIALLLNMLIMYIAVEKIQLQTFFSKVIATAIVFFWNFLVRKCFIYKKK